MCSEYRDMCEAGSKQRQGQKYETTQQVSSTRNETLSIMEKCAFECIGFEDKLVRVQFWSIPVIHDEIKENEKKMKRK